MTRRYILGGGPIFDGRTLIPDGALLVDNGTIAALGATAPIREHHEATFIDAGGRLILPGLLNAHTHLYSALAPGLRPVGPTSTFHGVLENLWWQLDAAHDEESVYYSAMIGLMDHVRCGTTTLFDHHASMNCVSGSLEVIAGAVRECGLRASLCFETSERTGRRAVSEHIEENIDFHEAHRGDPFLHGAMGLHANLTLGDESLSEIADSRPKDMPIHVHVGEAAEDLARCVHEGFDGPVDRLNAHRLVDETSLLVHAIHLSARDAALIAELHPVVVLAPESNSNNGVGSADPAVTGAYLLGTDGMSPDMVETLRATYLLRRSGHAAAEETSGLAGALGCAVFSRAAAVRSRCFPGTGTLHVGSCADVAVLDYVPVTPIDERSLLAHLVFGARRAVAWITIVDGKILYRDGAFTTLDEPRIRSHAKRVAEKLHARFYG